MAIKQLDHIKASIQTYASIKQVMHPSSYQPGLTSIQVPTNNRSYKTVIDSKEIEEHLINRNCKHYTQAEHTAMAHHLIQEKWEYLEQQSSATRSWQAQQTYQNYQQHVKQYFTNCINPTNDKQCNRF
jgi:hypothetical protein